METEKHESEKTFVENIKLKSKNDNGWNVGNEWWEIIYYIFKKCCLMQLRKMSRKVWSMDEKNKLTAFRKTNDQLVELTIHAKQTCSNK